MRQVSIGKFIFRLTALTSAPVLAIAFFLAAQHARTIRSFAEANASDQARNLALTVELRVASLISGLKTLAASPLIDDPARWEEFHSSAMGFLEGYGAYVILADTDMNMILNTRSPFGARLPKLPVPKGHAAAPEVMKTGMPSVGDIFMGPIANEPLIAVVVPVLRKGAVRFLLLASVETRQFQELVAAVSLPPDWSLRIEDSKGELLAERRFGSDRPGEQTPGRASVFSGEIRNTQWRIVLDMPEAEYYEPMIRELIGWIVALGLAFAASLLAEKVYGSKLASAVQKLLAQKDAVPADIPILEIAEVQRILSDIADAREQSRLVLELFVQNAPAAIAMFDREMRYIAVSKRFLQDYGIGDRDIRGLSHYDVFPEITARWKTIHRACLAGAVERREKDEFPRADGRLEWVRWEIHPWLDRQGSIGGVILFSELITERIASEERIARTLEEKEVLIRELYHRTNNSMQRIISLLILYSQAEKMKDRDAFIQLIGRKIEAMSLVHRQLSESGDVSYVDLAAHIREVSNFAFGGFPGLAGRVRLDLGLENIRIVFDVADTLGLSVLELLDDALARGFPDGRTGIVRIDLRKLPNGGIELSVADDGIPRSALPEDGWRGLGMKLVSASIRDQLNGTIEPNFDGGTAYTIRLTELRYVDRTKL